MTVSLQATLAGNTDIAVGSVIGSSIFNTLVTLGLAALIIPLRVSRQLVRLDIPVMIFAGLLVFTLAANEELTPLDGLFLVVALIAYLGVLHYQTRHSRRPRTLDTVARAPWLSSALLMLGGLLILVLAGHLLLGAAVDVASDLGLSERIIGLTLIGVGTSLPCLATSLIAALRGEREIAVGNVIGSNLFNLLGVLGFTALVAAGGKRPKLEQSVVYSERLVLITSASSAFCPDLAGALSASGSRQASIKLRTPSHTSPMSQPAVSAASIRLAASPTT